MFRVFNLRALLLVACTLLLQHAVFAQNKSNTGTDFWVGYGHHQFMEPGMGNSQEMVLYLSAEQPANVTVTIDGTSWTRTYNIPANTSITTEFIPKAGFYDARLYSVPPDFGGTGSEGVFSNKGIHIVSNVPIVANVHIFGSASSGATMLMPTGTWGYSYTSLNSQQYYQDNCFSWMYVVAKEDNTVIEITPSVPTRNGRPPGVPFTVTINKGDIYQLIGDRIGAGWGHDLTGTKVRSVPNSSGTCHPIGAFSGSSRTYIACPSGSPAGGDNIIQQLLPERTWGRRYLTAPFSNGDAAANIRTGLYRVLVTDPATVVKRNGTTLTGLTNNAYYEFVSNTADLIEADKPVLVAQYMSSGGACPNASGPGDPEMIYLSPLGQGVKKTAFYRSTSENITVNYVTLIVPTAALTSLLIDGSNSFDHTYPHSRLPEYTVVVKRYNAAIAQGMITCDQPFTGITYGMGIVESYGYNVGLSLNDLTGIGQIKNSEGAAPSNDFSCKGSPVKLSVLLPYQPVTLTWKVSNVGAAVTPAADVVQNAPAHAGTQVVNGATYYQYTLPQDYTFSQEGDYYIPVVSLNPAITTCQQADTTIIPVTVKPSPAISFTMTNLTACTLDTVYLSAPETDGGFTFDKWTWTFPDGSTANTREAKALFLPGTQQAKLQAVSTEGCVSLDSASIEIHGRPTAGITNTVPAICETASLTFTDNASAFAGSPHNLIRSWDFGNGAQLIDTITTASATYQTYGTYKVKLVTKVSALCISDTASVTVTVHANPAIALTVPDDCLPADRSAAFTSSPTTPDGQTISDYQWDFGDGSGAATTKDAVYRYAKDSTYPVHYTVTTSNGCSSDTTFDVAVSAKPELSYSVVPPVCENATGPASAATATVLNGATGSGIYSGPGIDAAGSLSPAIAGAGMHTAKYVFTTSEGCKDSVTTTFTVRASPVLTLTLPSGCLPVNGEASFTSEASTIDGQTISDYQWNFGDGTALSTAKDPVHHYAQPGEYDVVYTATTVNGCTNDTTVRVELGMLPELAYGIVPPVCASQPGPVTVATASVENSLPGNGIYSGTGVSGTGSFDPAVAGVGTHAVKYIFTTSEGCVDSASSSITVNPLPVASFVASADSVCQGGSVTFTDMSTGGVSAWNWNFGDGGTASTANPSRRFNTSGDFDVQLRVTDAAGCVSEPFSLPVVATVLPVIDAGPDITVRQGAQVQLQPTANDSTQVTFQWSPAGDFIDPDVLRASLVATRDAVYTLTATSGRNCTASDNVTVTVIKAIKPPNVFSPNGDNINDTWVIRELVHYPDCVVEVFNRYGQRLFRSAGYGVAWDGKYRGSVLPIGTYYYVIQPGAGEKPVSGSVTILK